MDFEAIKRAYPNVRTMQDAGNEILDADNKPVTVEQSKIDAARAEIDTEFKNNEYQRQRTGEAGTTDTIYPNLGEQFDLLFKDIAAGTLTTSGNLYTALKAVKDKYPKPS